MNKTVEEQVSDIIKGYLKKTGNAVVDIKEDSNFREDLGCDSLNIIEIVTECEIHWDIECPDENCRKLNTVGDLVHTIKSLISDKKR